MIGCARPVRLAWSVRLAWLDRLTGPKPPATPPGVFGVVSLICRTSDRTGSTIDASDHGVDGGLCRLTAPQKVRQQVAVVQVAPGRRVVLAGDPGADVDFDLKGIARQRRDHLAFESLMVMDRLARRQASV